LNGINSLREGAAKEMLAELQMFLRA